MKSLRLLVATLFIACASLGLVPATANDANAAAPTVWIAEK